MQRDIKLIGLDLDGTTLNSQKEITPRVVAAIQNAIQAGITVLPATGRSLEGIPPAFLGIPGIRYALCANGAKVYDLATDTTLLENCFERHVALDILDVLGRCNTIPAVFIDGRAYGEARDYDTLESLYNEKILQYLRLTRHSVPSLRQLVAESPHLPEKITMVFPTMEDRTATKKALAGRDDCVLTSSMPGNLEINAAGVDKGQGLLQLGRLLGYEKSQVMAVGDGSNDLEMLKTVGYAVAMANSTPGLLKVADFVTASCDEDGVALAIEAVTPNYDTI